MFKFSEKSLIELKGVEPLLQGLTCLTLNNSKVDFAVFDGLRTLEQQKELLAKGASTTMNSKHLTGKAVDLVPVINGKLRWELGACCEIARAMQYWSRVLKIDVRWGGVWDSLLADLKHPVLYREVEDYTQRQQARGRSSFIDGVHFELV